MKERLGSHELHYLMFFSTSGQQHVSNPYVFSVDGQERAQGVQRLLTQYAPLKITQDNRRAKPEKGKQIEDQHK